MKTPIEPGVPDHDGSLNYEAIQFQIQNIQGKVLTVMDAAITDREQRSAVRDLINQQFSRSLEWIYELSYGHSPRGSGEQSPPRRRAR